jgi:hypothetical protein
MTHYSNPAVEAAWQRSVQQAREGIIIEPLSAFRFEAEMHVLAEQKGLIPPAAKNKFNEFLNSKNISKKEFRTLSDQEKLTILREALA